MTNWTNYIDDASITITNVMRQQHASCEMRAHQDGTRLSIADHDHVIITGGDSRRIFGGFVSSWQEIPKGPTYTYEIKSIGYGWLLDHPTELITKRYNDKTELEIITDVLSTGADRIGVGGVSSVLSEDIDDIAFVNKTPREILDYLCQMSGAVYYVDPNPDPTTSRLGTLYYFSPGAISAPFDLSDTFDYTSTFPYGDLRVLHRSAIANRITAVGAYALGDPVSATDKTKWLAYSGNPSQIVNLPWKVSPLIDTREIAVYKNTGTDAVPVWTEQTVGQGRVDELTDYDCLHYFNEQKLEFFTAPSTLEYSVRFMGREWQPISYTASSTTGAGTYGRWIERRYTLPEIADLTVLQQYAEAKLATLAAEQITYTCTIEQPGLKPGMSVTLTHANLGLSAESLIVQSVRTHLQKGAFPQVELSLGSYKASSTDIIREIWTGLGMSVPNSIDFEVVSDAVDEARAPIVGQPIFVVNGTLAVLDDQDVWFAVGAPGGVRIREFYATVKTAPTGASIIMDVEYSTDSGENWATIFSVLPTIAASSRTSSAGTLSVLDLDYNTLLRLNIDQVGSTIAGAYLAVGVRVQQ